jgi:hypothetical protein
MKLDNFKAKKMGEFNVAEWISLLNDGHINTLFTKYIIPQKNYIRQAHVSDTLPLLWTRNDTTFEEDELIRFTFEEIDIFKDKLERIIEILHQIYPDCIPVKILLAKLLKNRMITPHIDEPPIVQKCHRVHIVMLTNENVLFKVDNKLYRMKAGEIYEINNVRTHSVVNKGDTDRVHLIIDMLPRNYIKDTTTIRDITINESNINDYEM